MRPEAGSLKVRGKPERTKEGKEREEERGERGAGSGSPVEGDQSRSWGARLSAGGLEWGHDGD